MSDTAKIVGDLLRERREIAPEDRDLPLGWWYHAKKRHALFPGVTRAKRAHFLGDYYRSLAQAQGPLRKLVNFVTLSGFNAWVGWRARQVARRYGMPEGWAKTAERIARSRFADPNDLALYRITDEAELDVYLRRFEHSQISRIINPRNWTRDCVLAHKIDFYLLGMATGLPVPELHAIWSDGKATVIALPEEDDVIIKPNDGEGGDGVELVAVPADAKADSAAFARWIERHCADRRGEWIVQERLRPSAELDGLALSALPTIRVTTCLNEAGEPEVVTSVLRFPSDPNSRVDNIKSGGLMAPIDPATGILGQGCRGRGVGDYDHHPSSGAPITGRLLPSWEAARDLARDTHDRHFRQYSLVGWDIAPTTRGPVIIEGNGKPCMIVAQRANRKGLGATRFGELVAWHLAERRAGRNPLA